MSGALPRCAAGARGAQRPAGGLPASTRPVACVRPRRATPAHHQTDLPAWGLAAAAGALARALAAARVTRLVAVPTLLDALAERLADGGPYLKPTHDQAICLLPGSGEGRQTCCLWSGS
jgi:hypothetical protein